MTASRADKLAPFLILVIRLSICLSPCSASRCHLVSPFAGSTTEAYIDDSLHGISAWRSTLLGRDQHKYDSRPTWMSWFCGGDEPLESWQHGLPA